MINTSYTGNVIKTSNIQDTASHPFILSTKENCKFRPRDQVIAISHLGISREIRPLVSGKNNHKIYTVYRINDNDTIELHDVACLFDLNGNALCGIGNREWYKYHIELYRTKEEMEQLQLLKYKVELSEFLLIEEEFHEDKKTELKRKYPFLDRQRIDRDVEFMLETGFID